MKNALIASSASMPQFVADELGVGVTSRNGILRTLTTVADRWGVQALASSLGKPRPFRQFVNELCSALRSIRSLLHDGYRQLLQKLKNHFGGEFQYGC